MDGHISYCMRDILHWLPVHRCILFRVSSVVWRYVLGIVPTYLLKLFIPTYSCSGRQSLRSASRSENLWAPPPPPTFVDRRTVGPPPIICRRDTDAIVAV